MAPDTEKPRRRNRRRKRRNISSSSSSSSSSSESSEDQRIQVPPAIQVKAEEESDDASSSSSSSSPSSSSSSPITHAPRTSPKAYEKSRRHIPSRSPSPPNTTIPPLIPANPTTDADKEKEKALKEKFRKFWMASIADEFKDDLEEIRKEPNLSTSRLSLLIDSLASGADVFSASNNGDDTEVQETAIVLGSS